MNVFYFEKCESTQSEAWKIFEEKKGPTLAITDYQTQGRGRQNRRWEDDDALNLKCSLALPMENIETLRWLPIAAGVSVLDALQALFPQPELRLGLRLKWPNDIYWKTSKLGGILCESRFQGDLCSGVVIGLGLNIGSPPKIQNTISIADLLADPLGSLPISMRNDLAKHWAGNLVEWNQTLHTESARTELRMKWNSMARLSEYPEIAMHDKEGKLVTVYPLELSTEGTLRAQYRSKTGIKEIQIDQADSFRE